jgi:hypothetical protein
MKIIELESCEFCPHRDHDYRLAYSKCSELGCVLRSKDLNIPKDCPLPSVREYVKTKCHKD